MVSAFLAPPSDQPHLLENTSTTNSAMFKPKSPSSQKQLPTHKLNSDSSPNASSKNSPISLVGMSYTTSTQTTPPRLDRLGWPTNLHNKPYHNKVSIRHHWHHIPPTPHPTHRTTQHQRRRPWHSGPTLRGNSGLHAVIHIRPPTCNQ